MSWSIIAAVNNEQILNSCLLASPDINSASEVVLQTGYTSAADAYNAGIGRSSGEIMVFAHQDVYLPEGWANRAQKCIEAIAADDPDWGVIGIYGVKKDGRHAGHVYYHKVMGERFEGGMEVATLDELLLIVRRSSGLKFDPDLDGFHMYGADICLEAGRRGMKSYAISAFCVHNSNDYKLLPLQFWKAYFYMRKKWKSQLPIKTTCIEITRYYWPMIRWNFIHSVNLALGRKRIVKRVSDPTLLYSLCSPKRANQASNVTS